MDQIVKPLYENKNENAIKCMHKTFYQSKNSHWNICGFFKISNSWVFIFIKMKSKTYQAVIVLYIYANIKVTFKPGSGKIMENR